MIWTNIPWIDRLIQLLNDFQTRFTFLDDLSWYIYWFLTLFLGAPLVALALPFAFLFDLVRGRIGPLQRKYNAATKKDGKAVLITGKVQGGLTSSSSS